MPISRPALFISCEHADFHIPPDYRYLFKNADRVLKSHRGYDRGAAELARFLSRCFGVEALMAEYSRLLIDLNRSLHHQRVFSEYTRPLPTSDRQQIIDYYYKPYRDRVLQGVRQLLRPARPVLHLSVHSFTPVMDGVVRNAGIGLLYDPKRTTESGFCRTWQDLLATSLDRIRVRRNYPYRGSADGLTSAMRKQLGASQYMGVELELNQALVEGRSRKDMDRLFRIIADSLEQALATMA